MRQQRSFLGVLVQQGEYWSSAVFLFLFFFLPLLFIAAYEFRISNRLETEGTEAIANVVRLEVLPDEGSVRRVVHYAFLLGGDWVGGTSDVSQDFFAGLQEEDRISIRYLPDDPTVVEIEPGAKEMDVRVGAVAAAGLFLFCVWLAGTAFVQTARIVWLSRHGVPVEARATKLGPVSDDEGPPTVTAFWIRPDGQSGLTMGIPVAQAPAVGGPITLLTDPTGKRESRWEGEIWPRAPV